MRFFTLWALLATILGGCGDRTGPPTPPVTEETCRLRDLGEAADAVARGLPDYGWVHLEGVSDPRILVWQNARSKKVYFAAKILGAQGRLLYVEKVEGTPHLGPRTVFEGTITAWKYLAPDLAASLAAQFKKKWNVTIAPEATYVIFGKRKPKECQ